MGAKSNPSRLGGIDTGNCSQRTSLMPVMAAAFCNFGLLLGGLKKVDKDHAKLCYAERSNHRVLSNVVKKSSQFCYRAQRFSHWIHGRELKFLKQSQRRQASESRAENLYNTHGGERKEQVTKATLIWRAIKLPIYSVALVPLTVGGAAAYLQTGLFSAGRYFVLLVSSIFIITWLNLSNDVYDFDTGADKNKRESVVNLAGSRSGTLIGAYLSLGLGFMGLTWTSVVAGNFRAISLLACAIICGYIYQCPPFRLSYHGLGEPLCFAAFGPFATAAFYLLLGSTSEIFNPPLTGTILSVSVLVGITTSLILFCSHFHQVRFGTERGSAIVKVSVMALYSLLLAFALSRAIPFTCILLCALTLPMGRLVINYVEENHKDKGKIFMAKYYCVRLHTLFGTALAAGLVMARILSQRHLPRVMFS